MELKIEIVGENNSSITEINLGYNDDYINGIHIYDLHKYIYECLSKDMIEKYNRLEEIEKEFNDKLKEISKNGCVRHAFSVYYSDKGIQELMEQKDAEIIRLKNRNIWKRILNK